MGTTVKSWKMRELCWRSGRREQCEGQEAKDSWLMGMLSYVLSHGAFARVYHLFSLTASALEKCPFGKFVTTIARLQLGGNIFLFLTGVG